MRGDLLTRPESVLSVRDRLRVKLLNPREHIRPEAGLKIAQQPGRVREMYQGGNHRFYVTQYKDSSPPVVVRDWVYNQDTFMVSSSEPIPQIETIAGTKVHLDNGVRVGHVLARDGSQIIGGMIDVGRAIGPDSVISLVNGNDIWAEDGGSVTAGVLRKGYVFGADSRLKAATVEAIQAKGKSSKKPVSVDVDRVSSVLNLSGHTRANIRVVEREGVILVRGSDNYLNGQLLGHGKYIMAENGEIRLPLIDTSKSVSPTSIRVNMPVDRVDVSGSIHGGYRRGPERAGHHVEVVGYVEKGSVGPGHTLEVQGGGDLYAGGQIFEVSNPPLSRLVVGKGGAREVVVLGNSYVRLGGGRIERLEARGLNNTIEVAAGTEIGEIVGAASCVFIWPDDEISRLRRESLAGQLFRQQVNAILHGSALEE